MTEQRKPDITIDSTRKSTTTFSPFVDFMICCATFDLVLVAIVLIRYLIWGA